MRVVVAPRKYSQELKDRATRLALDARRDPATSTGGRSSGWPDQHGFHPEALRTRVRYAEIDDGTRPGTTTVDATRVVELERDVRELPRANEILRTSAFFAAAGARPQVQVVAPVPVAVAVEHIDTHRDRVVEGPRSESS